MKLTINWLKDYIIFNDNITVQEICDKLTEIGLECETKLPNIKQYDNIIVAKIIETKQHPNADKLKICKVFDGKNYYQIVCGAPNAKENIIVALAKIDATVLNGELLIKKSNIRGIDSEGMMCSAKELSISEESNGIIELNHDCNLGKNFIDEYKLLEKIPIEIKLTPNRGDCASIYGIARDLSATGIGELKKINLLNNNINDFVKKYESNKDFVLDKVLSGCNFTGIVLKNINIIQSPDWLKERLNAVDIGSKNIIIDVLNYVMISIGQPMHAYDYDILSQNGQIIPKISIDYLKNNKFIDLKKITHDLSQFENQILTIQDEFNDLSIAGIIGGNESKITNNTKNILIESAYFPPEIIAIAGQKLKIITDSRFRFERGINKDINFQRFALMNVLNILK